MGLDVGENPMACNTGMCRRTELQLAIMHYSTCEAYSAMRKKISSQFQITIYNFKNDDDDYDDDDDAVLRLALPCSRARTLPPEINQDDFSGVQEQFWPDALPNATIDPSWCRRDSNPGLSR